MTYFRKAIPLSCRGLALAACALIVLTSAVLTTAANAALPPWLQHVPGASAAEAALYRVMHLPGVDALYPRPPKEAQAQLQTLVTAAPTAELYALRAHTDEQALEFPAAEADWKVFAAQAKDAGEGKLQLAAYYARRLQTVPEVEALTAAAALPDPPDQVYADPNQQRSWRTFTLLIATLSRQGAPAAETVAAYNAFVARYPTQPAVYARYLEFLLSPSASSKALPDYPAAEALIARYRQQFPQDIVFPLRAQAQLALRRGNTDEALAAYDKNFQPLWPADLTQSYFALLKQTHNERTFAASARVQLAAHPDGPDALNAVARLFDYDAQAGRMPQAQQTLDRFRIEREARKGAWTPLDLYTLAQLSANAGNAAEAARYDYALASTPGNLPADVLQAEPAAQAGLAALTHLLLSAPDQPLALGTGNLSLYRDIATLDQGPGYWNGILSLWLNGTSPATEYDSENAKAQSYFHRAKAAELLADLDRRFPAATERVALHAELIGAEAQYGESAAVVADSTRFLADYPTATQRLQVGGLLADAYARQGNTAAEFALYDRELAELAAASKGMPLTAAETKPESTSDSSAMADSSAVLNLEAQYPPVRRTLTPATEYRALLDRYVGRLVALKQLPQALTLLRRELDRSPDDPLLYERLATFLQQNNLTAQQEQVFQAAIQKFGSTGWYDRLARLYLKEQKRQAFATLTRRVSDIFAGTDLDAYFANVTAADEKTAAGPQLALALNLYAAKRFPHDLVFTRNLLGAYQAGPTADTHAYDALIRRQWFAADDLRDEFMQYLTRTGKLEAEFAQLQPAANPANAAEQPAAAQELAELQIWTSHYESAGPLMAALSEVYPASADLDDRAVSLFRSFSYLDPTRHSLERAVGIERNLLIAAPDSPDRLATLGDLYAEATAYEGAGEDLTAAAPYWQRIPSLHPGTPAGYLTTATIFWDYFQYDDALSALRTARTRFNAPALYGYEAGAIEENRHDLPAAVAEYTRAAAHPVTIDNRVQLAWAALEAFFSRPSDAADSNLQATVSAFFGTEQAHDRLVQLAERKATRTLVDEATAREVATHPADLHVLTLRADVLTAQARTADLAPLLTAALAKAQTLDEAAAIGTLAQMHMLTTVFEAALTRQIALSPDPVGRMELAYQLAQSLESRKETAAAQKVYEQVYAADPRSLGVVRATVDFYARSGQQPRAIATLLQAAKVATPALAHDFTLEAANRANESGNPAQARALAVTLLPQSPYDAAVLGVIATSYARAKDEAGLRMFYLAKLDQAAKDTTLDPATRKAEVALLRRGLIPALTRLGDFAGATDQYIALISAFPQDTSTANEAALYALKYKRQPQLLGFLQTTVRQSAQDSRYAVLLAQTQTTYGDLQAALAAYDAAITVRKDRADLYQARVALELLLAPSDPALLDRAAADDERLYVLTYHDPQWQTQIAELRARQNRPAEAVKALEVASPLEGAKAADNALAIAVQLADWSFAGEAADFANRGAQLAGPHLLTEPGSQRAARYARVLTRKGDAATALRTLVMAARAELAAAPGDHELEQYADGAEPTDSTADDTSADATAESTANQPAEDAAAIRKHLLAARRAVINANLKLAVRAMGSTIATYATPENKAAYAGLLDRLHTTDAPLAIEAAAGAGFAEQEATWRAQALLTAAPDASALAAYVTLQQSRLQFKQLAQTLEAYAVRVSPNERAGVRQQAAAAYRDAGDLADELRLTRALALGSDVALRDRYFDLLLHGDSAALTALAAGADQTLADAAVNYTLAHGTEQQALAAEAGRARSLPAVWRPAAQSLTALFFAGLDRAPAHPERTTADFQQALASEATIGQRTGHAADATAQLVGDVYFPYASGYGIFLTLTPATRAEAEDFLPAPLEAAPSDPQAYLEVARSEAEADNLSGALTQYAHVLELQPAGEIAVRAHDEQAVLLFRAGQREHAVAEWHAAFVSLHEQQTQTGNAESFYTDVALLARQVAAHRLDFRADFTLILQPYLAQNGNYRSNELLRAAYEASPTPAQGAALITSLADAAPLPDVILTDLNEVAWLPPSARVKLLERSVELARHLAGPNAESTLLVRQQTLLVAYIKSGDYTQAEALLQTLRTPALPSASPTTPRDATLDRVRLQVAAHAGRLPALLDSYKSEPESTPELATLAEAAAALAANDPADTADAALLRQFVFDQKQSTHTLLPTDYLALAQARLALNDVPAAVEVLRRLTLEPAAADAADSSPYINTDSAALLLESTRHPAEAVPLLLQLSQAVPWKAVYRLRLAQAQMAAGQTTTSQTTASGLLAVARDTQAPYAVRVKAARALARVGVPAATGLGSAELDLLASAGVTKAQAAKPFYTAAQASLGADSQTPAPDRIALLRRFVAASPFGLPADDARVQLFLLEAAPAAPAPDMQAQLRMLDLAAPPADAGTSTLDQADTDTDTDTDVEPAPPTQGSASSKTALPSAAAVLDPPIRVSLARAMAQTYAQGGDIDQALAFEQLAITLDQALPGHRTQPDAGLTHELALLQATAQLESRNKVRRPVFHAALNQTVAVRPRLSAADLLKEAAE